MTLMTSNILSISFLILVIITLLLFYFLNKKPNKLMIFILIWTIVHSILAFNNFYMIDEKSTFNKFVLIIIPGFLFIFYGAFSKKGIKFSTQRNLFMSPIIHIVRIPVEIILYYLFLDNLIPIEMTFEGRNFDIIAGITAPFLVLFLYYKNSKKVLLIWNIITLGLVLFILANGILSSAITYKAFGFSQANKAIMYFPFVLLPAVIVPLVIYTHLSDIVLIIKKKKNK